MKRPLSLESLERRLNLAGNVPFDYVSLDSTTGILTIEGTQKNDVVVVSQAESTVTVDFTAGNLHEIDTFPLAGRGITRLDAGGVVRINFYGGAGDDQFTNKTSIPSYASGGSGDDTLVGGLGADTLDGGADDDTLIGGQGLDD